MLLAKLKNGQSRIVPKKSGLHCRTTITTDLMMRKADEFLSGFQQILDVLQNRLLLSRIYSFLFVVTDTALKIFSGWHNQVWRYYKKNWKTLFCKTSSATLANYLIKPLLLRINTFACLKISPYSTGLFVCYSMKNPIAGNRKH